VGDVGEEEGNEEIEKGCKSVDGLLSTMLEEEASERACCLLVLSSVASTPQWIRLPKPHDDVHDVGVFVCKCVLGSSRASQPLNILAYAFSSTAAFSLRLMPLRLAVGAASASAPALSSLTATQRAHPPHLTSSLRPPLYTSNMMT
jgi:hypothetical protein